MNLIQSVLLVMLSAVWGGSFIFMRILSPIFGPVLTAGFRLLIGGIFLLAVFKIINYKINWKRDYKILIVIGVINSAIPFFLFSYAALYIPASMSVIINSMSPMFGAIFSAIFLSEKLSVRKIMGLVLGTSGVTVISSLSNYNTDNNYLIPILACIGATICYGIGGVIIKLKAGGIEPKAIAAASQLFAGISLLPLISLYPIRSTFTYTHIFALVVFAILCSALAYLIYYKLMSELGPTKTLTVTFLMPIFGVFWSSVLLNEKITLITMIGGVIILAGTYLVTSSKKLFKII